MENDPKKNILRIAILSSFVTTGISKTLANHCGANNIATHFYLGAYNQYAQEFLDENSGLYKFKPDLIILFIDLKTILGDFFFLPYQVSAGERKNLVKKVIGELRQLIKKAISVTPAKILVHNFEVPVYSPLGILENKEEFGFVEGIENLNQGLARTFKYTNQVFVFDYNAFCSRIGKDKVFDPKMYYLGDIKLAFNNFETLANEYMAYVKPLVSLVKKCLVLDLDNTLWGGIVGEDGLGGLKLGPTPEGRPFWEFQKYILALHQRGVILALNSKNNLGDALKVIREHPYMILKEEHFACVKINWQDKVTNLKEIAAEINIGLDSLIFIDDDPTTREMVRNLLPEIAVINLPDDPAFYPDTLMRLNDLSMLQITDEDKKRGTMYQSEKNRATLLDSVENFDDFIKSLNLTVTSLPIGNLTIPRIAQLTQKTNQFNVTTIRYNEEDIARFASSKEYLVECFRVGDKFGDYGITGVLIVKMEQAGWRIDTFLLSCRVLGKNIEFVIMAALLAEAKKQKVDTILANFISTAKNKPAEDFYRQCGFQELGEGKYLFNVSKDVFRCATNAISFVKSTV